MFEKCEFSNRQKWMVASFSILTGFTKKFESVSVLTKETLFLRGFILRPTGRLYVLLINGTRDFLKRPSVWEIGMFVCANHWKFWTFSILQLWNKFSQKRKTFSKNWSTVFSWKYQNWNRNISIQTCSVRS